MKFRITEEKLSAEQSIGAIFRDILRETLASNHSINYVPLDIKYDLSLPNKSDYVITKIVPLHQQKFVAEYAPPESDFMKVIIY